MGCVSASVVLVIEVGPDHSSDYLLCDCMSVVKMSSDDTSKGGAATTESPVSDVPAGSQETGNEINGIQIVSLTMCYVESKGKKKNRNTTGLMRHIRKLRLDAPGESP